jgi:hypothetical protein
LPARWIAEIGLGTVDFAAGAGLEVAVDVHALVQDAHDVEDAFGGGPIKQRAAPDPCAAARIDTTVPLAPVGIAKPVLLKILSCSGCGDVEFVVIQ